jgi:transcriptional regulator with XRE-family HTH domain
MKRPSSRSVPTEPAQKPKPRVARAVAVASAPPTPDTEEQLERHLGHRIRALRLQNHLTIADVAEQAQVSRGMLSKIENAQTATSLESLTRIASALGTSLSHLFSDFGLPPGDAQHVKAGKGMEVVRRGTRRGHTYHLLAYDKGPQKTFEPFLITMDDASEVFPRFEHPGTEFIYMLQGQIEYRHGRKTYLLKPGDSLSFRGSVPHGPERLVKLPIYFLSVIIYGAEHGDE